MDSLFELLRRLAEANPFDELGELRRLQRAGIPLGVSGVDVVDVLEADRPDELAHSLSLVGFIRGHEICAKKN